jgi:acetyl esterase/lipase
MDIERRTLLGLAAVGTGMTLAGAATAQTIADGGRAGPADPTEILKLWPGAAPGGERVTVTGAVTERSTDPAFHDRFAQYTTDPILTVFRPERPNGTALLLIPGGGYRWAVLDKEGYDVARVFAATGTTCFVLRYRLPDDGWEAHSDAPLQDAQRAMRLIRSKAADYGVDPAKVGVLGASAGGHLAGLASARTDATYAAVDAADGLSFRPDFSLLMYPVATMRDPHVHAGSRSLLLGAAPTEAQLAAYSLEEMDWKGAAPVWLVHAMDDASVPVENTLQLLTRLKADGVKSEAHLFQEGSHGFGIRLIKGRPAEVWPELARAWAARAGFAL